MKKNVLIMSIMTFIFFGCSNNDSEPIQEANLKIQTSKMLQDLVANEDFRNYFNPKSKISSSARYKSNDNNGNGVMFIKDGNGAFWFIGIRNDNDTPDFPDDDFVDKVLIIGGKSSDIKVFKNGYAMAQSSSNSAVCGLIDFSDFSSMWNDCYDIKGHINMKLSGNLGIDESPWGTFYFIEYDSIFLHGNNITISDETITIVDEQTGEFYCNGDATIEKSVSFKLVLGDSGLLEGSLDIK